MTPKHQKGTRQKTKEATFEPSSSISSGSKGLGNPFEDDLPSWTALPSVSSEPSEGASDEDELEPDTPERKRPGPTRSRASGSPNFQASAAAGPSSPPQPSFPLARRRSNATADVSMASGRYPTPPTSHASTSTDPTEHFTIVRDVFRPYDPMRRGRANLGQPVSASSSVRKSISRKRDAGRSPSKVGSIADFKAISSASTLLVQSLTDLTSSLATISDNWKTTLEIDLKSGVRADSSPAEAAAPSFSNSRASPLDWSQRIRQKTGFLGVFVNPSTAVNTREDAPITEQGLILAANDAGVDMPPAGKDATQEAMVDLVSIKNHDVETPNMHDLVERDNSIGHASALRSTTLVPSSTVDHASSRGTPPPQAQLPSSPPRPALLPTIPQIKPKTTTTLQEALTATFTANAQIPFSPPPRVGAYPKLSGVSLHRPALPPSISATTSESAHETTRRVHARRAKENVVYTQRPPSPASKVAPVREVGQEELEWWCEADVAPVRFRKVLENRETSPIAMNVRFLRASMNEKEKSRHVIEGRVKEQKFEAVHELPDSVAIEELIAQTFGPGSKSRGTAVYKPALTKSKHKTSTNRSTPASDLRSPSPGDSPRAESVPISIGRQSFALASEDEIDMLIVPDPDSFSSSPPSTYSSTNILQAGKWGDSSEKSDTESVLGKRVREEMVIVQPAVAFARYDDEEEEEFSTPPASPTRKRAKMDYEEKALEEPDLEVENEHDEWKIALLGLIKGKKRLEKRDLQNLHKILTDVYGQRKEIEPSSELAQAVYRVSQLSPGDVPGSDALGLRALARTSARSWGLTSAVARNQ